MTEILERYLVYNQHATSYTWKCHGVVLDMSKSLQDNNIADEASDFQNLALDEDENIPSVQLYYNDDLTCA